MSVEQDEHGGDAPREEGTKTSRHGAKPPPDEGHVGFRKTMSPTK